MKSYTKGAKFERELVWEFWNSGWVAIRAAGSGKISLPVPDIIALKNGKIISIECKSTKNSKLNVKKAVKKLKLFLGIAGGKAYISVKFPREKPRFYDIEMLEKKGKYTITMKDSYYSLDYIIGSQELLSLHNI
ncbi:MAG TPA: Holliday junction resolvase [Candidatus Altiarchaeales archaeon]|nr:Holliday junction resolvase [Candidatus Altiarchaeales archaeon]